MVFLMSSYLSMHVFKIAFDAGNQALLTNRLNFLCIHFKLFLVQS
jgi:hypothetical protein